MASGRVILLIGYHATRHMSVYFIKKIYIKAYSHLVTLGSEGIHKLVGKHFIQFSYRQPKSVAKLSSLVFEKKKKKKKEHQLINICTKNVTDLSGRVYSPLSHLRAHTYHLPSRHYRRHTRRRPPGATRRRAASRRRRTASSDGYETRTSPYG